MAEVLGANGQFASGAPDDIRRSLKLNIYLRFLAIADPRRLENEMSDEDDDTGTFVLAPDADESEAPWDTGSEFPPPPMILSSSSGDENLSGEGEREDRFDLPSDADESQRPEGRRLVFGVPDTDSSSSDVERVPAEVMDLFSLV
jgi:hypothetical protein